MSEPIQATIVDALNHIKTWKDSGEFEKARQGLNELLEFEPTNVEAQKLMEELKAKEASQTAPVQETPVAPAQETPAITTEPTSIASHARKISAVAIVAVAVVLIISATGGYFAAKYFKQEPAAPVENSVDTTVVNEQTAPDASVPASTDSSTIVQPNQATQTPESQVTTPASNVAQPATQPASNGQTDKVKRR